MPVAQTSAAEAAATRSRAARFVGLSGNLLAGAVAIVCLTLLAVRFVVLPRVESYRPEIAQRLTEAVGTPVTIDALTTGWDGWNPRVVVTGLRVKDKPGDDARTVLMLPRVDATVSWLSLAALELRLKELAIDKPELTVTRMKNGHFRVAGFEFDPDAGADDGRVVDWLLRQREIVVRDALVMWNDQLHDAPQLVLDDVQFRLEHPLGSRTHRFGLTGTPPPELAAPIDLRGEFHNASAQDWTTTEGRLYLRMDYADLSSWDEWIPFPVPIDDGRGAVRMWLEFASGALRDLTADVELADVKTRLDPALPSLELAHVGGRLTWHGDRTTRRIATRDLTLVAGTSAIVTPMDFTFDAVIGEDGRYRSGRASTDVLELAPLAVLAASIPMPARWRDELVRYAPRGTLKNARYRWEGPADAPTSYGMEGDAVELGVASVGTGPGVSGLSAKVQADERGGSAKLGSRSLTLALPRVFAAPIAVDTLSGTVRWHRADNVVDVEMDGITFANADTAGTASGSWRATASGPGTLDMKAQLTRADVRAIPHYLPAAMDAAVRDWVRRAFTVGVVDDVRLTLKGDLAHFPFPDPKQGTFVVTAKSRGVTFDFADAWPSVADIDGELRLDRTKLVVDAAKGRIYGAQIGRTKIEVDNVVANAPRLTVDGEVNGTTADFLEFVAKSPVGGWTDHALDGAQATGNGRLKLRFDIPLGQTGPSTVAGEFAMTSNELRVPGMPVMSQVDGKVAFTEKGVNAEDLAAEVFGGPARLSIASGDEGVRVSGKGSANLTALRGELPETFADRVAGTTDWTLALEARAGRTTWTVDSTLRGATIDLPAPVGKSAGDAVPLRVERKPDARGTGDSLVIDMARVGRVLVQRHPVGGVPVVDRALVLLGRAVPEAADNDRAGIWVRGDLPKLNLDDWLALRTQMSARPAPAASPSASPPAPTLRGVDIEAAVFEAFGRKLNDVKASARSAGEDWRVQVTSREAAGTGSWRAPTAALPTGRLVARLSRMSVPDAGELTPWQGAEPGKGARADGGTNPWPELDIQSDALFSKGRDLGRFEMVATPQASDWRIEKMVLSSDAGRVQADGWWRATGRTQQTRLDVKLEAQDAGAMLKRFGFPDVLVAAPTTIKGQLDWPGAPSDFDPALLSGSLVVDVGAGQFTKIEPGLGKLLGVLSLQALPRRITLDFRDVFSEGFAFDTIEGRVKIARGVMTTDDLKLIGPAARVEITGDADLAKETQRLSVRVVPALSTTFSAGTAGAAMLLLAANPLVAAAVGAGALLAQKVMKDPIEQMFSYEYRVTGSWSDPVVERIGSKPSGLAPAAPAPPPAAPPTQPAASPAPAPAVSSAPSAGTVR